MDGFCLQGELDLTLFYKIEGCWEIYLKKDYSTVAFFDNFNRTTSCIFMLQFIQI